MKFDTEYELQEFRNVQSEYFDEEGEVYPSANSPYLCNRMLKLIDTLESELKNKVGLGVRTRSFRFSGISRGKKFVQEIISEDRESAIAHFETAYPHLTWRTITEQL